MRETLEMMKSIITGKEQTLPEKLLIKEYQDNLSPNILAYFYTSNFGLIYKLSKNYSMIADEDKASFCLQEIDRCLQTYDLDSDIKFITYFMTCYKRKLYAEAQMLNHDIRKANMFCGELDSMCVASNLDLITDEDVILDSYNLTDTEIEHCKLLSYGYSLKEIAKILKLAPITIYKRNSKIKEKILNLDINFA